MSVTSEKPPGETDTARALLQFEQVGENRFRALYNQDNFNGAIFGGQPVCQALAAAQRTVPGWPAHSCTGYFLKGGVIADPVEYNVEIVRDGRRYAARRVLASQDGRPICDLLCSFHDREQGVSHQLDDVMDVPSPESLLSVVDFVNAHADRVPPRMLALHRLPFPIELRVINPEEVFFGKLHETQRTYWFRMPSAAAVDEMRDHECLLAFMSDYWFAGTAGAKLRSPISEGPILFATLNHSIWFHSPVRADEWLLFRTESPWAGEGRGLTRGLIYDRHGRLVASTIQEASMRTG